MTAAPEKMENAKVELWEVTNAQGVLNHTDEGL